MNNNQIKILVISNYRNAITVRPEAEVFIGLAKMGYQIAVMTFSDSPYLSLFKKAGIDVIEFHPQKKFDRREIGFIRSTLKSGGYHILHLFNGKAMVNGLRAARGLTVKVVLYRGHAGNVRWYDPSAYFKFLHPRVDAIICNSENVKRYLDRCMVLVKNKTITINKGHKLEWYADIRPLKRVDLGIANDDLVLVCSANNRPVKGVPYLLKSLYYLPEDLSIQLLMVGKDMDTDENLEIVRQSKYADRVHFLGFRKDSLSIVMMADFFMLASLYGESLTKAVLESMALGTPAIITDLPGNRAMIEDGKNGFLVPVKDPKAFAKTILKVYQNPELSKNMGEKAREHIKKRFNNDITIQQYHQFYKTHLGF